MHQSNRTTLEISWLLAWLAASSALSAWNYIRNTWLIKCMRSKINKARVASVLDIVNRNCKQYKSIKFIFHRRSMFWPVGKQKPALRNFWKYKSWRKGCIWCGCESDAVKQGFGKHDKGCNEQRHSRPSSQKIVCAGCLVAFAQTPYFPRLFPNKLLRDELCSGFVLLDEGQVGVAVIAAAPNGVDKLLILLFVCDLWF